MGFTAETAAIAAKKSHEPTSARFVRPIPPVEIDTEAQQQDEFRRARLAVVRAQLVKIDAMLTQESDPAKIDRLASAAIRLNEQERQLSNRSMPPVQKPKSPKSPRQSASSPEPDSA